MKIALFLLIFFSYHWAWAVPYAGYPFPDIHWKAPVANAAALPAASNLKGDSRVAMDTFDIWAWDGAAWQEMTGTPTGVDNVTASLPLSSSGGNAPNITCRAATGSVSGCLSAADWTTFNAKEPAISSGTTSQYWRGDKTFQTLNTTVVTEGSNLYYTNARADARIANAFANPVTITADFEVNNGHYESTQTTPPSAAVQASAGTGASCSVAHSTDTAGQITITVGTVGISTGSYCILTFNAAYDVAPICSLTPASSTLSTSVYVTSSTTTMTVNFAIAGGVGNTYVLNFNCIETQ